VGLSICKKINAMSRSIVRRTWQLVFAVLALTISSIHSQILERVEVDRQLPVAVSEALAQKPDGATTETLRRAFTFSQDGRWDKAQTTTNLAAAVQRGELSLVRRRQTLGRISPPPGLVHLEPRDQAMQVSRDFVDRVSAIIRRNSVLEEILPATSTPLDHEELRTYLRETAKVPDYDVVADSFRPDLEVRRVTFSKPTNVLRLYGGNSPALGRYYFCCLRSTGASSWADGSGLATPPNNLQQHLGVATIPAGTAVIVGTVADNFPDPSGRLATGGNAQFFVVPHIAFFPFREYQFAREGTEVSKIAVLLADRTIYFRR
jgi:hypothetical protein